MIKDYYSILGIANNATKAEIRKAYRRLAKMYHPDVNKAKDAHDRFIEITEAYEILINQSYRFYKQTVETATTTKEWRESEYKKNEEYEKFRQEAREKAQRQAKMRYEEFHKQNEAFQKSGFNDLLLLFKILTRILAIFIFLLLFILPVYAAFFFDWTGIFILFITWPFAGIIGWNIYDNRKSYFLPGKFYYGPIEIKRLFVETSTTDKVCYFCKSKLANSKPLKLELLKLKDIKLRIDGFRQYRANYINDKVTILVPRSRKAFIIHSINSLLKVVSILAGVIFLDISSYLWRIIIGFLIGSIVSELLLVFSRTKSSVSFLYDFNLLIRVCLWLFLIIKFSTYSLYPFNIRTSEFIYFLVTSIIIFDCILMQLINLMLGKYSSKPIVRQYSEADKLINSGYKVYNDMPVFSIIYPFFKWIFG